MGQQPIKSNPTRMVAFTLAGAVVTLCACACIAVFALGQLPRPNATVARTTTTEFLLAMQAEDYALARSLLSEEVRPQVTETILRDQLTDGDMQLVMRNFTELEVCEFRTISGTDGQYMSALGNVTYGTATSVFESQLRLDSDWEWRLTRFEVYWEAEPLDYGLCR